MIDGKYEYFAFISYKSQDKKWAKWLQRKLESYSLPTALRKEKPTLPDKIRPVFRDVTDLSGGKLEKEIEKNLNKSKYLIVICSPRSAQSPWVSKEVQHFINQGREGCIIPFIIGGTPYAANPENECFPEGLRQLTGENEILGINIKEMGREAAVIKVIARMFDLRFGALWQRYERAKRKKRRWISLIGIMTTLFLVSIIVFILYQNRTINQQHSKSIALYTTQLLNNGDAYNAVDSIIAYLNNNGTMTMEMESAITAMYNQIYNSQFTPIGIIRINQGRGKHVAISPNKDLFASGDERGNLFVGKLATGKIMYSLKGTANLIEDIQFSPDNKKIAFTTLQIPRTIILDLITFNCDTIHNIGSGEIYFIENGMGLIIRSKGDIYKYNFTRKQIVDSINIYSKFHGIANNITYNETLDKLIVGINSFDDISDNIAIINPSSMEISQSYRIKEKSAHYAQLKNDSLLSYRAGKYTYFFGVNNNIVTDSIKTYHDKVLYRKNVIYYTDKNSLFRKENNVEFKIVSHDNYITDFDVSEDERFILTCGADGLTKISNGLMRHNLIVTGKQPITNIEKSNDIISISTWDNNIYLVENDSMVYKIEHPKNSNSCHGWTQLYNTELWYFDINESNQANISVYDLTSKVISSIKPIRIKRLAQNLIVGNDYYGVVDYYDLTIYDKKSNKEALQIKGCASITPDSNIGKIAYLSNLRGDTIIIKDINTTHSDTIINTQRAESLSFSNSSSKLAVANQDYSVTIYDIGNNYNSCSINNTNLDDINFITFSSDDKYVIFTSEDGTVSIWDIDKHNMLIKLRPYCYNIENSYPTVAKFIDNILYVGTLKGDVFKYDLNNVESVISTLKKRGFGKENKIIKIY